MEKVNKIISDNLDKIIKTKEPSKSEIERGVGLLSSLKIIINVLYAFMIFQTFLLDYNNSSIFNRKCEFFFK